MINELTLLNFIFLTCCILLLARSWGYIGTLLLVECLWVILYCLFIISARYLQDLSFFMVAIIILILSAVELVIGLLCFIIYYHTFNSLTTHSNTGKTTALYGKVSSQRSVASRFIWKQ